MNRLRHALAWRWRRVVRYVKGLRRPAPPLTEDAPSATPPPDSTDVAGSHDPQGSTPSAEGSSDTPATPRSTDVVDLTVRPSDVDSIDVDAIGLGSDLPEITWRQKNALRSSYMYKLHESKRRKLLLSGHGHRQRVWAYNDKRAGCEFAESVGVSVPATIVRSAAMTAIDWGDLPDRFVVKPQNGAANRGVYLLERTADGRYHDLMRNETSSADEIRAHYADLVERKLISAQCTVEELLAPRPELRDRIDAPDDFKVYCFYDRVPVVMQRRMYGHPDPKDWKFKFWTRSWEDLGAVKYADRVDPDLERPAGAEELIAAAERLGRQLAIPFVRLDLYDTDRGVVFGEVTAHPGPPEVWTPEIDELLGREWENAEARLLAEGISAPVPVPGSVQPAR